MSEFLARLGEWMIETMVALGYLGVALFVLLENLFPPIPSELVLPMAGFLVAQERLSFAGVVAAATTGSVVGALMLYYLACWLGEGRLRRLVKRYGRYALLEEEDLDRTREWFDRYGRIAVLIGRLVPMVRSLISIPAGLTAMPLVPFVIYTTIGSTIWNTLLISLGWILGKQWRLVERYLDWFSLAIMLAGLIALLWFIWRRLRRRMT